MIAQNTPRIKIYVYTDPTLNEKHKSEFISAKKMLEGAGATVILAKKTHSKIIAIDERVIIEGFFNWLSASRTVERFKREESSIIYTGKHVSLFIQEAMNPIKAKAKNYNTLIKNKNELIM